MANRFEIVGHAGTGGMGSVYQAIDLHTSETVAIKVLSGLARVDKERFAREARLLSELHHPGIVRYVTHGASDAGEPFLIMEWLEGEELSKVLARKGLTTEQSLAVMRRAAEALGVAHARGIVHRDVKPQNLLLVGGDPSQTKLLDFGVARQPIGASQGTRSGVILGTVGYMAPEQASGERDIDARADVFSLGCVLFECLAGRPPFAAEHAIAVLAKVIRDEAPRLVSLRPTIPAMLDELVARMLSKDKRARPADGSALLRELEFIEAPGGPPPSRVPPPMEVLTGSEQRFLTVLLAQVDPPPADATTTLSPHVFSDHFPSIEVLAETFGGDATPIAYGGLLVSIGGRTTVTEQAEQGASLAIALRERYPRARVAVVTGRGELAAKRPSGSFIDRAAELLRPGAAWIEPGTIRLDDTTAGLLASRFEIGTAVDERALVGKASNVENMPRLLGKRAPFVGRQREVAILQATYSECQTDSVARVVVVTGPAGMGKSRLRQEFIAKLKIDDQALILSARCDPVHAASAFTVAAQLVRDAAEVFQGEPVGDQPARLRAHLSTLFTGGDLARNLDFLSELARVAAPETTSARLAAARNERRIMSAQVRSAFEEWLVTLCANRKVVLFIEDLHWGDLTSVNMIDAALGRASTSSLMLVALARDEVHDRFPRLWASHGAQEVRLVPLTPRASEQFVRAAIAPDIDQDVMRRLVDRAQGNPFYLEELVRHLSEHADRSMPDTVLAMVHARLHALDGEARRVLRAASIFGESFWHEGVQALLGRESLSSTVSDWLQSLVDCELVQRAPKTRFTGQTEYVFRHSLWRDGAYEMLTEADRKLGHRLAADWLEASGEADPSVLAEHLRRAGEASRAIPYLLKAAWAAHDGGQLDTAIELAEAAIAYGATGETRGILRLVQGRSHGNRFESERAMECTLEALDLLGHGTTQWLNAAAGIVFLASRSRNTAGIAHVVKGLATLPGTPTPIGPFGLSVFLLHIGLVQSGQNDLALLFRQKMELADQSEGAKDPSFVGFLELLRASEAIRGNGLLGRAIGCCRQARHAFDEAADPIGRALAANTFGRALLEAGALEQADDVFRETALLAERAGTTHLVQWTRHFRASIALSRGAIDQALQALAPIRVFEDVVLSALADGEIARAHLLAGRLAEAEYEAKAVIDRPRYMPTTQPPALLVLGQIQLATGKPDQAKQTARRGLDFASSGALSITQELRLLSLLSEAHTVLGEISEARDAASAANAKFHLSLASFEDPVLAERFAAAHPRLIHTLP